MAHLGCGNPNTCVVPDQGRWLCCSRPSPSGIDNYWAVLPDAPNGAKSCTDTKIKFPVVLYEEEERSG